MVLVHSVLPLEFLGRDFKVVRLINLEECIELSYKMGIAEFPFLVRAHWGKFKIIVKIDYDHIEDKWIAISYKKGASWLKLDKEIKNPFHREYEFVREIDADCEFCNQNFNMIYCTKCKKSKCTFCFSSVTHECFK